MNREYFLHIIELINQKLVNLEMDRTFNSIGSNVFFEFGQENEVFFKNGKKCIEKEWSIWISNASWRISRHREYIVGSDDAPPIIQSNIKKLLGKRFKSIQFLSQFLDVEFNFEDGYQITTFFNWSEENQWTLLLPDEAGIRVDCSNWEAIKNVQDIAKHFPIIENFKKINLIPEGEVLNRITNENGEIIFHFNNEVSINFESCSWRLEKDSDYLTGRIDDWHARNPSGSFTEDASSKTPETPKEGQNVISDKMSCLIGKRLKQIAIVNEMMDAIFEFEDRYVLKTFTCFRSIYQWKIVKKSTPVFTANIQIEE